MEGYLTLVTKGFTSYRARKVWVVLDRQQLTWYDHLDMAEQIPKKLKGMMFVRDAVMKKVSEGIFTNCLLLECENVRTMFSCEDSNVCATWYKALTRAIVLHHTLFKRDSLPEQYIKLLQLDNHELSKVSIARAYKKLCLKEHPDKGGDPEAFNKIKEAYSFLTNRQAYLDELDNTVPIQYEATVRKKEGKVGLGMSVNEDFANGRLMVGKVMSEIDVVSITEGAEGSIRAGDRLIGIDSDDCSNWTMSRVVARLNLFRVPVKGTVAFTFERRISEEDLESDGDDDEDVSPAESPLPTTFYSSNNSNSPMRRDVPQNNNNPNNNNQKSATGSESETNAQEPELDSSVAARGEEVAGAESKNKSPADSTSADAVPSTHATLSTEETDSAAVLSPNAAQAKAAARERLRLRALAAAAAEESGVPIVIAAPPPTEDCKHYECSASSSARIITHKPPHAAAPAPALTVDSVLAPFHSTYSSASRSASSTNRSMRINTRHPLHSASAERLAEWKADAEIAKAVEEVGDVGDVEDVEEEDEAVCERNTVDRPPVTHTDANRFHEALVKQQLKYSAQISGLETALQRAETSELQKDTIISSLTAENSALKGTVSSLAKLLDGRGLSGSDQENIKLHRTIADLDKIVKQQENALAQLTLIQRAGTDAGHERDMLQYEQQSHKVESMLLAAMLRRS